MKEDTDLKDKFFESNKELIELFNELHRRYDSLETEASLVLNPKYGIVNLAKLNGEAVFDAINYFNKSCPYCKTDLYGGHIRNNYEIDHFFPIAKGGQDVPWNLLPICRNCNRKKGDKLPFKYLDESTYNECNLYLEGVLFKITNSHEDKLQRDEITHYLVMNLVSGKISQDEFIARVYKLFNTPTSSNKVLDEKLELEDIFSKERIDSCSSYGYFSVINVMTFQEVIEKKIPRKIVKEILIKLYGEPDKCQRFLKNRRDIYNND
ncbi:MAG: HNH endonuclease domain-containing protein [Paludibacter sp.]